MNRLRSCRRNIRQKERGESGNSKNSHGPTMCALKGLQLSEDDGKDPKIFLESPEAYCNPGNFVSEQVSKILKKDHRVTD